MRKLYSILIALMLLTSLQGQILRYSYTFVQPPAEDNELFTGIQAYWKLDETTGDAIDAHASYDGAQYNTPTLNQAGKIGTSWLFANASDEAAYCGTVIGDFGTNDFSISLWFYLTSQPGDGALYAAAGKYQGASPQWYVAVTGSATTAHYPRVYTNFSGSAANAYGTTDCQINTWYHFVATFNRDGYVNIYINGTQQGTPLDISAYSAVDMNNAENFLIGGRILSDSWSFDGRIDEVGIWYRVLTQTDINFLYNSGNGLGYDDFE
jgi:hypothetical protein